MNKIMLKILQALWRLLRGCGGCCSDIIIIGLALFLAGCGGRPTYVDGNSLQLGLIIPDEQQIYGFQILNYLNGVALNAPSNANFKVQRESAASNSYFGVVHISEHINTTVEVGEMPAKGNGTTK